MTTARGTQLYVGTCGWSYRDWAGGRFYPKGLRPGDWLAYYAENFTTVEINSTFYRLPRPDMLERWRTVTTGGFRFAVKLWRRITHLKRLADCESDLARFFEVAHPLKTRRGPLLVQLPPSLRPDPDRLDGFLQQLSRIIGRARWKVAVEFRHPGWLTDDVYSLLDRRGAALCLADMPRCPIERPNDVDFVYVRRHGPTGRYRGRYAPSHIDHDAASIGRWLAEGRTVYLYYNNDVGGHAVDNARQLIAALQA